MYKVFLPLNLKLLQRLAQRRPDLFGTEAAAFAVGGFIEKMVEMTVRLARVERGLAVNERDHELILDFNYDPRIARTGSGSSSRYGYFLRSVVIARHQSRSPKSLVDVVYNPSVSREWVAYWTYKHGSVWINYRDLLAESPKPAGTHGQEAGSRRTPRWLRIPLPLLDDPLSVTNEPCPPCWESRDPFPPDSTPMRIPGGSRSMTWLVGNHSVAIV